jgi:predicted nuclease of restriction endonuclease-like (RecB) superfamily
MSARRKDRGSSVGQKKAMTTPAPMRGAFHYGRLIGSIRDLLDDARRTAVRAVNGMLVATYWEIGRRIVEFDQHGKRRAAYGKGLVRKLSRDLASLGRGFSERNLEQMRAFHLQWPISQTLSAESEARGLRPLAEQLKLSWSHYVRLLNVKNENARRFYEAECLRGGWSIRQLERQIDSQFYERTALSRNKAAMLIKNQREANPLTPEQEIKDPYVLEFLDLKDEYSENQLEEALILHLESFLLELGANFTFVARQKRMRIGDEWYRVDLLFYHRRLRCLVLIDLKLGKFTHADAGQMHMYLNYAKTHWTNPDENPPVGLILCAQKDESVAKYSLEDLPNKVLAAEYRTVLPEEKAIVQELNRTRQTLMGRWAKARKSQ